MIGMKDQYFGVEVEMTGITREQAAQALANYALPCLLKPLTSAAPSCGKP